MPDFSAMTSDELYDRLAQIETAVEAAEPDPAVSSAVVVHQVLNHLREVALIHVQLAKRTATGWRPL